jgi:thiamine-monophosphate kinase
MMTGEFAAIERLRARLATPPEGEVWIGDDAAVLLVPGGSVMLLCADAVVLGVHADESFDGLDDLGWKAVAANVSDIAAMGGRPGRSVVTVAGPADTDLDLLYEGIRDAATFFACPVVGGDLTNARDLVVSAAVTGSIASGRPVLRSGARPADEIWVSGRLGAAAFGLRCLREGIATGAPGVAGPTGETSATEVAIAAHRRPRPSVEAGLTARATGATSMIDVSDGLGADLAHIADASGVGVSLEMVPRAEGATLEEAMAGGEDYVLVFTVPPSARIEDAFAAAGLDAPVRIGACTADPRERTLCGRPFAPRGWEHSWG